MGVKKEKGTFKAPPPPIKDDDSDWEDRSLPLSEFWDSLEAKQRHSLLSLQKATVCDRVTCPSCQELLNIAIKNIERGAFGKSKASGGKSLVLSRLSDGVFIPGSGDSRRRPSTEFMTFQNGIFDILPNSSLRSVILNPPASSSPGKENGNMITSSITEAKGILAKGEGGGEAPETEVPPADPCYCVDKYHVRFVDMLTYPRPIRKFEMLLSKDMKLGILREMLWAEVTLESLNILELMVRNRRLRGESDQKTLEELGFKNNVQVVITKVLGQVADDQEGVNEKNKQFVGDLLFGQGPKDASGGATEGGGEGTGGGGGGGGGGASEGGGATDQPVSIIETFRINGGYQVLGRTLEKLAREAVHQQWHAELKARENERALLASLEAEVVDPGDAAKKKNKKIKKKEKEKRRKQEEAERLRQLEEERERENQAKIRANQQKTETERQARLEQQRLEAEAEKRLLQEAMERKLRQDQRLAEERRVRLELEAKKQEEAAKVLRAQQEAEAARKLQEQRKKQQQQQQAACSQQYQQKTGPSFSLSSSSKASSSSSSNQGGGGRQQHPKSQQQNNSKHPSHHQQQQQQQLQLSLRSVAKGVHKLSIGEREATLVGKQPTQKAKAPLVPPSPPQPPLVRGNSGGKGGPPHTCSTALGGGGGGKASSPLLSSITGSSSNIPPPSHHNNGRSSPSGSNIVPGPVRPPPVSVPSPYVASASSGGLVRSGSSGDLGLPSPRGLPSPSSSSTQRQHQRSTSSDTAAATQGLVMVGGLRGLQQPTTTSGLSTSYQHHQQQPLVPRFCSQCGSAIVLGSRFCCQCGAAVVALPSPPPSAPSSSSTTATSSSSSSATSPSWGGASSDHHHHSSSSTPVGGQSRMIPRSAPITPRQEGGGGGSGTTPTSSSSNLPPYLQQLRQDGAGIEFLTSMSTGGGPGSSSPTVALSPPSPPSSSSASAAEVMGGVGGLPVFQFLRGREIGGDAR